MEGIAGSDYNKIRIFLTEAVGIPGQVSDLLTAEYSSKMPDKHQNGSSVKPESGYRNRFFLFIQNNDITELFR